MNDDVLSQPNTELSQDLEAIVHTEEPSKPKVVNIQATLVSKLNLADFQNAVPVIRELRIINDTEHKYADLELTLSSDPLVFKTKTWRIDSLALGCFCLFQGSTFKLTAACLLG